MIGPGWSCFFVRGIVWVQYAGDTQVTHFAWRPWCWWRRPAPGRRGADRINTDQNKDDWRCDGLNVHWCARARDSARDMQCQCNCKRSIRLHWNTAHVCTILYSHTYPYLVKRTLLMMGLLADMGRALAFANFSTSQAESVGEYQRVKSPPPRWGGKGCRTSPVSMVSSETTARKKNKTRAHKTHSPQRWTSPPRTCGAHSCKRGSTRAPRGPLRAR